jgi:hypothetical protein
LIRVSSAGKSLNYGVLLDLSRFKAVF